MIYVLTRTEVKAQAQTLFTPNSNTIEIASRNRNKHQVRMRTWSQDGGQVTLHSALAFAHTLAMLLVVCNQPLEIKKKMAWRPHWWY